MKLDATILLRHKTAKNHKIYSRKINRAIFYKEVSNFAFLEYYIKNGEKPSNPLDSFYYSFAFNSSKNIVYTYLLINAKDFIKYYEENIQINNVYFNKFNYVHWIYKNSKKMYDNFLKYKEKAEYNPILCVIKRTDKEFFFFKLKKNTEVFQKFVEKVQPRDMLVKLVRSSQISAHKEKISKEFIQTQIDALKKTFIENNDQISKIVYDYSCGGIKRIEHINDINLKIDRDVLNELLSYVERDIYNGGMVRVKMFLIRKAIYGIGYKHENGDFLGFFAFNSVQIDNKMNLSFSNKEIITNLKASKTINNYTILDCKDIEIIKE